MLVNDLNAQVREGRGKGYRNQLKGRGLVPAVVYGKGVGSLPIQVETKAVESILKKAGSNALVALKVDPGKGRCKKYDAVIKDVHYHPYKPELFHVDFHQISLKEELTATVPLRLTGHAPGVTHGGLLEQLLRQVDVSCLPQNIPDYLETDVSGMDVGTTLHVSDLTVPEGVKIITDPEIAVATVTAPQRAEEEAPEEEAQTPEGIGAAAPEAEE